MIYVDSSAFAKYYGDEREEKGIRYMDWLVEKAKRGESHLTSSFLMIGELVSVLDKWARQKRMLPLESKELLKRFVLDIKELVERKMLEFKPVDTRVILGCLEFIGKHHIAVNDAIHLHTALMNKSEVTEFVCSDKKLLIAARKEGLKTFNPEKV
ncbi:type II toxin-antitoxin system VapC family toxin [Candidatus Woesearchaeota archaeon]|nr:type II toxin-antitoxin system VapC family toxin [Candidatus Woesearchaeota archaeon]